MPSGNKSRSLGSGVTTFETFAAFGQMLPSRGFIQVQTGADLPADTAKAPQTFFFRTAVGKTFAQNQGFGRIWTPMAEFVSDRDLVTGAKTNWDIVPQMQVSLSKRQHILASDGSYAPTSSMHFCLAASVSPRRLDGKQRESSRKGSLSDLRSLLRLS